MGQRFFILLSVIFATLFMGSCSHEKTVFEEYKKFEQLSWNRFEILEFSMEVIDTDQPYDLFVHVRHLPEFPQKEMLVNLTIYSPSGDMRSTDYTLRLKDNEGNSLSSCMGDYCDLLIPARRDITFYEPGPAKFYLENKFHKVDLRGIIEIGFVVKEASVEKKTED